MGRRAAPLRPHESGGVAVVNHHQRVVVIGRREGPSLKVESNGNVTRILTTHQAGKPADENEGVVIAIPRNHQKVFGENGRRLADADPIEPDAPMDR